jgi:hypothetical protein
MKYTLKISGWFLGIKNLSIYKPHRQIQCITYFKIGIQVNLTCVFVNSKHKKLVNLPIT